MIDPTDAQLAEELIADEGEVLTPYRDSLGHWTIGVGRLLARGISADESRYLLANDIRESLDDARKFAWFHGLTEDRQRVIVNMIFNLGFTRFRTFRKMLAALKAGDYETASDEMLDSQWSVQVGARADRLAERMRGHE